MPMIQFSLVSMLELADKGVFTIEKVVEKNGSCSCADV